MHLVEPCHHPTRPPNRGSIWTGTVWDLERRVSRIHPQTSLIVPIHRRLCAFAKLHDLAFRPEHFMTNRTVLIGIRTAHRRNYPKPQSAQKSTTTVQPLHTRRHRPRPIPAKRQKLPTKTTYIIICSFVFSMAHHLHLSKRQPALCQFGRLKTAPAAWRSNCARRQAEGTPARKPLNRLSAAFKKLNLSISGHSQIPQPVARQQVAESASSGKP